MKLLFFKLAWSFYYFLPPVIRQILKNLLKKGGGHLDTNWTQQIALRDARGKLNIENALDTFCQYLDILNINSIENKECVEIGTGYVGTHSLVMWLLGAKSVTAMDLNDILVTKALHTACKDFDKEKVYKKIEKYIKNTNNLYLRVEMLDDWRSSVLENNDKNIFFEYLAPFDLLTSKVQKRYDFIFTVSVLEHIPPSIIHNFLESLYEIQSDVSTCMHFIDLTDHFDHEFNPFGFLGIDYNDYNEDDLADSRGNRLRSYDWINLFNNIYTKPLSSETIEAPKALLPKLLSKKYNHIDRETLLSKSILIKLEKDLN